MSLHGTRQNFGALAGKAFKLARPVAAEQAAGGEFAFLVQHQGFYFGFAHALDGRLRIDIEAVAEQRRLQRAVLLLDVPALGLFPQPLPQRLAAHDQRAALGCRRNRRHIARIFAAADQQVRIAAPFLTVELTEKEVRLVKASDTGAIHQPAAGQRRVDLLRGEGIEIVTGHRHGDEIRLRDFLPARLALGNPAPDFIARRRFAIRQLMFPAIELAHAEQVGAQADVARMTRVGDVAVGLHRLHQRGHAGDHRGAPDRRRRIFHAATLCISSENGSSANSP